MGNFSKYKIQIGIVLVLFIGLVAIEYITPKPQDWTPSFAKDDKIPYGNYVMFKLLPNFFPDQEIVVNEHSFYEEKSYNENFLSENENIILIARSYNKMDSLDSEILLQHVKKGGTIFMATQTYSSLIKKRLDISTAPQFSFWETSDSSMLQVNLLHPALRADSSYTFPKRRTHFYFDQIDASTSFALGEQLDSSFNYIRIPYGKGNFLLHSQPELFSNYNIVYANNADYIATALSYLPVRKTVWDEYYHNNSLKKQNSLRYIFSQSSLHAAWLFLLALTVLYVIFEGKRRQRIIPIITAPRNYSLEFITTIGRLYFHRRDNKDLAVKKFTFLQEHIRSKYRVNIQETKPNDAIELAKQLDINPQYSKKLFSHYYILNEKKQISNSELVAFYELIEEFYVVLQDK